MPTILAPLTFALPGAETGLHLEAIARSVSRRAAATWTARAGLVGSGEGAIPGRVQLGRFTARC